MHTWPAETLTRVPYWVYQDEENYRAELRRIFEGPLWNYVCLEADLARPGDFRTTFVGEMPVVVVRDADRRINAFENRCAHRGALIALDDAGSAKRFQCIYHAWTYNLQGDLVGVAFEKGSHGRGGMPPSFCKEEHGPRKLRTTTLNGLVFASLGAPPPIEDYLGEQVLGRLMRVLRKPVRVTAASAASCSAAPPRPRTRSRSSTWAATARSRRTRGRRKRPCAASGRPTAVTWASEWAGSISRRRACTRASHS